MNRGNPIYFHETNQVILPVYKCAFTSTHQAYAKVGKVLASFNDLIDYKFVEKITLVRNPFDRILSLYTRDNQNPDGVHDKKRTFEEFIDRVQELLESGNTDGHYNTLVENLSIHGQFMPDVAFKLEHLEDFISYIPRSPNPFPRANKTTNRQPDRRFYYSSDKIIDKVGSIYHEDLVKFGYDFES